MSDNADNKEVNQKETATTTKSNKSVTLEEQRAHLEELRTRRKALLEELESIQEEEHAVMASIRKLAAAVRNDGTQDKLAASIEEDGEEDPFKTLSDEERPLYNHVKNILEMATRDQASCRSAQSHVDAIFAPADGSAFKDTKKESEDDDLETRPPVASTEEMNKLATVAGANSDALKAKQRSFFVTELCRNAVNLFCDPYGNYFVQRVLSRMSADEISALIEAVGPSIPEVSCNMHGTRGVQFLIGFCETDAHYEAFCEAIANEVVPMVCDINANHVIHKLLLSSSFDEDEKENIYHIIMQNAVEIGMNKQGCCMIQRCLESAPPEFRVEMINALIQNTLQLVQDPFGNYVIQFLLDLPQDASTAHSTASLANRVIRQVLHHIGTLSCNKFGSNVIEKCLRASTAEVRQLLLDELTDPSTLPRLLTQSYANYVVQTCLAVSDDVQFLQLRDAIQPLQHLLKNSPYGVKIETKIQKRSRDLNRKKSNQGNANGAAGANGGQTKNNQRRRAQNNRREQGAAEQQHRPSEAYQQQPQQQHQMQQQQQPQQQMTQEQAAAAYYAQQQQQQQQQQPHGQGQPTEQQMAHFLQLYAQQQWQQQQQQQQQQPQTTQYDYQTQQYYQQQQQVQAHQSQQQQQQQYAQQTNNGSFSHSPYNTVATGY